MSAAQPLVKAALQGPTPPTAKSCQWSASLSRQCGTPHAGTQCCWAAKQVHLHRGKQLPGPLQPRVRHSEVCWGTSCLHLHGLGGQGTNWVVPVPTEVA